MFHQANPFCIHPDPYVSEAQTRNRHLDPSICGACECPIAGRTFKCAACNSDLHPFCRASPVHLSAAVHSHSLTRVNRFQVHTRPCCAVRREEIRRVYYTCFPCRFDVHPQCSQLPHRVPHGPEARHVVVLQVGEIPPMINCHVCGVTCGRWVYKCDVCSVYVHFWCLLSRAGGGGPTTTNRGLECNFNRPRHGQGQRYYGLPIQPPLRHYYCHYNGGYQHIGYQWAGGNQFHNGNHGGGHGGRIMGRFAGSLAVNLFCDIVSNVLQQGLFFF